MLHPMANELLTLPDGRVLEYSVLGSGSGLPLVFHHGTPGAVTAPRFLQREVLGRGLRLVTFSRPGYGSSTRQQGRRVVDVVADTAAVLDHIGATSSLVAGWSGGGPHALACAARLPGVRAALSIAGVGPHDAADLDFFAGMGTDNLQEFGSARSGESALHAYLDTQRPALLDTTPAGVIDALSTLLPSVDRAVITDEYGEDVAASFGEALRVGIDGWLDDDLAFIDAWGFDLSEIRVPVHIWQGELDKMVPYDHGVWLAAKVPGAKPHLVADQGHLSIAVAGVGRMIDDLIRAK